MPSFAQTTVTLPSSMSTLLSGDGHYIVDRPLEESLTLDAGQVMGFFRGTGYFGPVDETVQTTTLSGDGATTAFDLGHHSVDPESLLVLVGGAETAAVSIDPGAGTGGVDQIVFDTAPASGTDNVTVQYKQTVAIVAGVLGEDATTAAGEHTTYPIIQSGAVRRSKISGLPAALDVSGNRVGLLILED